MSANQEIIEARLCAYIDGQLPQTERAQLEKTLASNPEGRRMLEELARTRQMLRELPHAPAPPDLVDAVQARLERGLLLDEVADHDEVLRFNYWPRIMAMAAVLLLALGLGLVVVWVMPWRSHKQMAVNLPRPPLADVQKQNAIVDDLRVTPDNGGNLTPMPPLEPPETDPNNLTGTRARVVPTPVASNTFTAGPATHPTDNVADASTFRGDRMNIAVAPSDGRAMAGGRELLQARRNFDAELPQSPELLAQAAVNAPIVLVIHTRDLQGTNQILDTYLNDNRINRRPVPTQALRNAASAQFALNFQNTSNNSISGNFSGLNSGFNFNNEQNQKTPNKEADKLAQQTPEPRQEANAAATQNELAKTSRQDAQAQAQNLAGGKGMAQNSQPAEGNNWSNTRNYPNQNAGQNNSANSGNANGGGAGGSQPINGNGNGDNNDAGRVVFLARMNLQQVQAMKAQLSANLDDLSNKDNLQGINQAKRASKVDLYNLADKSEDRAAYNLPQPATPRGMHEESPPPAPSAVASAPAEMRGANSHAAAGPGAPHAAPAPVEPAPAAAMRAPTTTEAEEQQLAESAATQPAAAGENKRISETQNLDVVIVLDTDPSPAAAAPATAPTMIESSTQPAVPAPPPVPADKPPDK